MEAIVSFITEVGFPIVVSFYLLSRIENKLSMLIQTMHELPEKIRM